MWNDPKQAVGRGERKLSTRGGINTLTYFERKLESLLGHFFCLFEVRFNRQFRQKVPDCQIGPASLRDAPTGCLCDSPTAEIRTE